MIIFQFLLVAWAVLIVVAVVGVLASRIAEVADRAFTRHVDQALDVARDDWHDWEREVTS